MWDLYVKFGIAGAGLHPMHAASKKNVAEFEFSVCCRPVEVIYLSESF
jgi:hypothetical protein